jgi:formylglycine-generating enzyme required for sulfatase activity
MWRTILCLSLSAAFCTLHGGTPPSRGMAVIPGGSYTPVFERSAKARVVASFLLDELPVTNAQFLAFVRSNATWRRSQVKALFADQSYLRHWTGDLELGPDAPANAPVVNVSWFAARAFLKGQGKRLPTLDEWEFAARASATQADASREPAFTARILAWYSRPSPAVLPSVETQEADIHGVRALHGLVWEWVLDFNSVMNGGESRDQGGTDRGFFCGAGALAGADPGNYAAFMRLAFRSSLRGSYCVANLGFRGARSISSP